MPNSAHFEQQEPEPEPESDPEPSRRGGLMETEIDLLSVSHMTTRTVSETLQVIHG